MAKAEHIDFKMPESWAELTAAELKFVYQLLAGEYSAVEVKLLCLLRFNKAVVLTRYEDNGYWVKYRGKVFCVSALQLAEVLPFLNWLDTFPTTPIRPDICGNCEALAADFSGVPFGTFLAVDNYYQGYLHSRRNDLLDEIFALVYPRRSVLFPAHKPKEWQRVAVFYWIASLKGMLTSKFKNFFAPAVDESNLLGSSAPDIEGAMNAQIRALTKGDVTKEKEILEMDTLRALTELDAQAREFNEFNAKYGTK